MSENEFTVKFVAEDYPHKDEGYYRCAQCDASTGTARFCKKVKCESEKRTDGKNKIFKIKETK